MFLYDALLQHLENAILHLFAYVEIILTICENFYQRGCFSCYGTAVLFSKIIFCVLFSNTKSPIKRNVLTGTIITFK